MKIANPIRLVFTIMGAMSLVALVLSVNPLFINDAYRNFWNSLLESHPLAMYRVAMFALLTSALFAGYHESVNHRGII